MVVARLSRADAVLMREAADELDRYVSQVRDMNEEMDNLWRVAATAANP